MKAFVFVTVFFLSSGLWAQSGYTESLDGSSLSFEMVFIPEGQVAQGSEGENQQVEAFWMGSHEVTWELYQRYLEGGPGVETDARSGETVLIAADAVSGATMPYVDMSLGMGTGAGLPVGNVTRKAAARFCKWLSAKTGHFYRLPTEAEWEYAARAGQESPYFFGPDSTALDTYAWYGANSGGAYHPVGEKRPNPLGLYDIYGNVAEWVLDGVDPDSPGADGSTFPPLQEYPGILKGGSYKGTASEAQTAARLLSDPVWKQRDPQFPRSKWWFTDAPFAGFRVVRPLDPPPPEDYEIYWDVK
ncbi:formylglycine-generating enzyme family protein [Robiginitalea sediminis]|uniref:formylglycine-generating enzyme family protein n=1 Tax=Robiginitalea sediminis TaxID=1982593 RepID=UPI000B4BD795|nr:SUMF1/EgtB/PvdO family nonheme iron enzyme [Robiginitalea sediminis]